ncbi:BamA/TamA family outer membrane protein [Horticoccus luteus]|uniref:BamA/TamA family outer membrane protein n=1 Tax=Horticoccus luteus TaxID=2862869 RepID=A0A8F9TYW8_9BACT|nr:BamA/TamA family outer membrane protein [Horticoccus luteus]
MHGLGWWDDRQMRQSLDRLLGEQRGATLDANGVEDAAFLLLSALQDEGYLKAAVQAKLQRKDGGETSFTLDSTLAATLPRPIAVKAVTFTLKPGVRYYFDEITVVGSSALDDDDVRRFFRGESALFSGVGEKAYSAARVRRGLNGVQTELRDRGYAEAEATADGVKMDDKTGKVSLRVVVHEGPLWTVDAIKIEGAEKTGAELGELVAANGQPWTLHWQQDLGGRIRQALQKRGYADVRVTFEQMVGAEDEGKKAVELTARVAPGPAVKVGHVRFEGVKHTREQVLRERVRAKPGDPLNPATLEHARYRLGRLGVFDDVDLRYDPATGDVRDPVFTVHERRLWDLSLLAGYGSYEQLRGGIELRQFNIFGRAHQSRLLLVQSMKSSRGEYSYTVPELFGERLDGTARLFGLQRQEVAFQRQEYGGNFSVSDRVQWLGAVASAGYTFQALRNRDNQLGTAPVDNKQVVVASVDLNLTRDRRDNPLRPRRGYRWYAQVEAASKGLGGEVDYQRVEFSASYHTPWGDGRWLHFGFSHGVVFTLGSNDDTALPVNKRFYPGGDNSIRGYQEGEAAPRGADGRFVGAKSYMLANAEFEQALTGNWSGVLFVDGLGTATRLQDYPFNQQLYSVGLGVRYNSLIGPVRAEYGYNLKQRPGDPSGTFLISIGFPF